MENFLVLWCWKPVGYSPGQCIDFITKTEYKSLLTNNKISYACRLDPMACGILPVVIAPKETIKSKCESLQGNYKTYQFSMIKGIKTDSYDILGMPSLTSNGLELGEISSKKEQKYPIYSSKTVKDPKSGKMRKLFEFANESRTQEIENIIPTHPIDIKYIEEINKENIYEKDLLDYIYKSIDRIKIGEFRIDDIKKKWIDLLSLDDDYEIVSFEANVSSGTYIRGLANDMGGTAFNICRIGIDGCYKLDKKIDLHEDKILILK